MKIAHLISTIAFIIGGVTTLEMLHYFSYIINYYALLITLLTLLKKVIL